MEPVLELVGDGVDSVQVWEGNAVFLLTTVLFYCLGIALQSFGKPRFVPANVDFWKWRNIVISWVHGVVCGVWVFLCAALYPDLFRDPVAYINKFSYLVIPFSAGYFFYDFIDLMQHNKLFVHWEITLHHTIIISSFMYNWTAKTCVGYNVIALLAEINSIFLHLRKLLQMSTIGFDSKFYRSVSLVNLFTFIIFRLIPQVRLYAGFYLDFHRITTPYFIFFSLTVPTGVVINIILFWRLVKTDVLRYAGKKKIGDKVVLVNGNNNKDFTSKDE